MENPILVTGAAGRVGAVGRTVTELLLKQGKSVRAMVGPWRDGLLQRGLPVHVVDLATMADLHRVGRYDRMSGDVLTLTGRAPLSVQEFIRKNATAFTASAKAA